MATHSPSDAPKLQLCCGMSCDKPEPMQTTHGQHEFIFLPPESVHSKWHGQSRFGNMLTNRSKKMEILDASDSRVAGD
jgi:hypothetical protein